MSKLVTWILSVLDRVIATPLAKVVVRELHRGDIEYATSFRKFEVRRPAPQNALDLFKDRWASDLSEVLPGVTSGLGRHFQSDPRPAYTLRNFAGSDGTLTGKVILEVGPLEGGHAFILEQLGAERIVSIEANAEAFMKCVLVKNLLGMNKTTFLLGDIIEYLRYVDERFDFILCSGVLYHMDDPVELIRMMAQRTDQIFIWSHYYTAESRGDLIPTEVSRHGIQYQYFMHPNIDKYAGTFWGGNKPVAAFLFREDILRAFAQFGLTQYEIHDEDLNNPGGPCFSVSFWRPSVDSNNTRFLAE